MKAKYHQVSRAKSSIPAVVIASSLLFALPLLAACDALRISGVLVGKHALHLLQLDALELLGQGIEPLDAFALFSG